jgi:O-antigen/teichoic acid export membrane protein
MANNKSLLKNTAMLYVLTACNYIFGFITIPYLTRVLGVTTFGAVGFAQGVTAYIALVLDFGFILSATATVALAQGDVNRISRTMSAVLHAKVALCFISFVAIMLLCSYVPQFQQERTLIILFFVYAAINCFIPDFVYRGIEQMQAITYRTVAIKALFVACVFIFVKEPSDYLLVPVFYALGAIAAVVVVYFHLRKSFNIRIMSVEFAEVVKSLKASSQFFLSRIASTFYSSMNILVIGLLWPGSVALGSYSATDKAISAGRAISSPIADSLYPYMIRTKDFRKLILIAVIGFTILALFCVPCWLWADQVCIFLFGEEYEFAGVLLRLLLPLIPMSIVIYLFGFPALSPLGLANIANASVVAGAVVQVLLLLILWIAGVLSVEVICISSVLTESVVLAIRLIAFIYGLKSFSKKGESKS